MCGPGLPPLKTGDSAGSTAIVTNFYFNYSLMCSEIPIIVPLVPTPEIKISILPLVYFQISGPVVSLCIFVLALFAN